MRQKLKVLSLSLLSLLLLLSMVALYDIYHGVMILSPTQDIMILNSQGETIKCRQFKHGENYLILCEHDERSYKGCNLFIEPGSKIVWVPNSPSHMLLGYVVYKRDILPGVRADDGVKMGASVKWEKHGFTIDFNPEDSLGQKYQILWDAKQ